MEKRPETGFYPADILLPAKDSDLERFAVIACDQFTSQPEYWEKLEGFVGDAKSALRLILPEYRLSQSEKAVPEIHAAMEEYVSSGALSPRVQSGFVITKRTTKSGTRTGIIGKIDLEKYEYRKGAKPLIRATEGTIEERIPPRMAVRRGAKIESPHILILIDDAGRTVIEPAAEKAQAGEKLYDFELNMGGGHIAGWALTDAAELERIQGALLALINEGDENPLLFAVGDGNHSLATAKACWEEAKKELSESERLTDKRRYALAEIENIHDDALIFEPIHRIVKGIGAYDMLDKLHDYAQKAGFTISMSGKASNTSQKITIIGENGDVTLYLTGSGLAPLAVGTIQAFLDDLTNENDKLTVDYIHGEDALRRMAGETATGILLPAMGKSELFPAVIKGGSLPRKTFSMGESTEKRYYLECRALR
ncbi:MAG: DUF1015 domain-containing protein [Eubacteriales bacterium]|nr:DUF1015 domain-containing protein [Eubacteriales bacterium]MDD3882269.1 DUF1015 domain-containing protein [Eubacteriales bacterium]MDD4512015.1 DUF1015 domain-containing protein [Eubacteriales bacterium]